MRSAAASRLAAPAPALAVTIATLLLAGGGGGGMCGARAWEVRAPLSHAALEGDLEAWVSGAGLPPGARLELLQALPSAPAPAPSPDAPYAALGSVPLQPANATAALARLPCGLLAQGGRYALRVVTPANAPPPPPPPTAEAATTDAVTTLPPDAPADATTASDGLLDSRVELRVRWPGVRLSLAPAQVQTYPALPVTAVVEFPNARCRPAAGAHLPDLWLELLFCGHDSQGCAAANVSAKQVLYAEQLREYPLRRSTSLRCELFGQAGVYALVVRAGASPASRDAIHDLAHAALLKATWSEKFVFNVHARSIFPCDSLGGGVAVLFQYPRCILEHGDRVRLFARLSADVAALAPPSSLHYTAEQRVTRGQHKLHFHCDLFSERYVEYCFVYVSQALTGAVSDVRMDCVPTHPLREGEAGGWGGWSAWSACSSTCGGGTRSRYRACDSPPPSFGAPLCAGEALQTEACGRGTGAWDCPLGAPPLPAGAAPQLQAERAELQAEVGPGCRCGCTVHLGKPKPRRLLLASSRACPGRAFWLVQAEAGHAVRLSLHLLRLPCAAQWLQVHDGNSRGARLLAQLAGPGVGVDERLPARAPPAPVRSSGRDLLLDFFCDELTARDCPAEFIGHAQQIPLSDDISGRPLVADSLGTDVGSHTGAQEGAGPAAGAVVPGAVPAPTGAVLTGAHVAFVLFAALVVAAAGCLSLQYVHRYRKYQLAASREDADSDAGGAGSLLPSRAASSATLLSEVISLRRLPFRGRRDAHRRLREEDEDDEDEDGDADDGRGRRSRSDEHEYEVIQEQGSRGRGAGARGRWSAEGGSSCASLPRTPPASPASTPRPATRSSTRTLTPEDADAAPAAASADTPSTACARSSSDGGSSGGGGDGGEAEAAGQAPGEDGGGGGGGSERGWVLARRPPSRGARTVSRGSSVATLANGHSTPTLASLVVRSGNPKDHKDHKDKRNRERLLAGSGSEFSLPGPDHDLELDYYDYNVSNAGAVPGSFLGMDPAYLVWIPPFAPGFWEEEGDQLLAVADERLQSQPDLAPRDPSDLHRRATEIVPRSLLPSDCTAPAAAAPAPAEDNRSRARAAAAAAAEPARVHKGRAKPPKDKDKDSKAGDASPTERSDKDEKETRVEKSPGDNIPAFCDFLDEEDDIKFADDEDEDECNVIITQEPKKSSHIKA